MPHFPPAPKKGNYKLLERMRIKDDIYAMLVDGYNSARIQKELNISSRTFYRYYNIILAEEPDFLSEERSRDNMQFQFRLGRDKFLEYRLMIEGWLKDNPESKDRSDLMNLASELTAAILKIYDEGPAVLARHHTFKPNPLVDPGSTGLRLILNKKKQEVKELEEGLGGAAPAPAPAPQEAEEEAT